MIGAPYAHVSMVLDDQHLALLSEQYEASVGDAGFVRYRCCDPPGPDSGRVNTIAWLGHNNWEWLHERLRRIVKRVNDENWGLGVDGFQELQFTRYLPGEGYGWHSDVKHGSGDQHSRRTVSMVVLLKNPDGGGGIELQDLGVVRLKPGDAVVFPSDTIHRALPVLSGVRESLIYWTGR